MRAAALAFALALTAGCDSTTAPPPPPEVTFDVAIHGGCLVTINGDRFHAYLEPDAVVAGVQAPTGCSVGYAVE